MKLSAAAYPICMSHVLPALTSVVRIEDPKV